MAVVEKSGLIRYKDADGNLTNMYPITKAENVDGIEEIGEQIATATSTDGVNYTVTVPGITELKAGIKFTMIPDANSTSGSVSLNVNGLGSLPLKARRLMNTGSNITAMSDDWIRSDSPITVMFDGYWWITTDFGYAHASYLYGTVPVNSGGTGQVDFPAGSYLVGNGTGNVQSKTPAEVRADIGAMSSSEVDEAIRDMAGGMQAESHDITLLTTGWVADGTYPDYGYRYAYALNGVTAESIANLNLDANSVKPAVEAGMLSACETVAGYVYFYSAEVPASNLTGTLMCSIELPFESVVEGFDPTEYATKVEVQAAQTTADGKMSKSGGTMGGTLAAGSSYQAPATALLRNSKILSTETNPTVNGEINWVYA